MRARLYQPTPATLRRLAAALRRGELVAAPTETVYGLAANALDPAACARIFHAKGRPSTDPLIVHVLGLRQAAKVAELNPAARRLAARFWPGPLTLVLPKKACVPAIVTAGLDSVAIRSPRHPAFRALLRASGVPLAAPSANPFGYISPTTAGHVRESLGRRIRHILDGGPSRIGLESTIVDLRDPLHPRVLRPGWITAEALSETLGVPVTADKRGRKRRGGRNIAGAQIAPGMLTRHYSPRTPLTLVERITLSGLPKKGRGSAARGLLFFARPKNLAAFRSVATVEWLSARGDVAEASRTIFEKLRRLDAAGCEAIVAERAPDVPQARALNDRLARAAAPA